MRAKWQIGERTPTERAQRVFEGKTLRMPLWQRIDVALLLWIVVVFIFIIGLHTSLVLLRQRAGAFDPPVLRQVPDERILTNVRDALPRDALLDAVFHEPDNRIYIAQEDGVIHRYNPATGLWSTEQPFDTDQPVDDDFVLLRSGCGADHQSSRASTCPDRDSVWALGADGSLARRVHGRWEIVVSNSSFIGADGQPVESEQLVAAAISENGTWLVVGTKENGVGIYNIEQRRWLPNRPDLARELPSLSITQLVFWDGYFWVGTPEGLGAFRIRADEPVPLGKLVAGRIVDLDADARGALWVLGERPCAESGTACLWLGKFSSANADVVTVIDQRNHFPSVNLANLQYAQYWDHQLILVGEAGIYAYDDRLHGWEQLFANPVLSTASSAAEGFFFGYSGGVGAANASLDVDTWDLPGENIIKLVVRNERTFLALSDRGNVYVIDTEEQEEVQLAFERDDTALDPATFTSAVASDHIVLFFGPDGALLHDTRARSYEDIEADDLPDWLKNPATQFITTDDTIYALPDPSATRVSIYLLPVAELASRSYFTSGDVEKAAVVSISGPVERVWEWGNDGLGLIAGGGRIYHIAGETSSSLIGERLPNLSTGQFRDVVQMGRRFFASLGDRILAYDLRDRAWSEYYGVRLGDAETAEELAAFEGNLLLRTNRGRLLQDGEDAVHIGDERGFEIGDAELSDVLATADTFYLAGNNRVERYDSTERQIDAMWEVTGQGALALIGLVDDAPLSLSGERAFLGEQGLLPDAGAVQSLSMGAGRIWTVRDGGAYPYLLGHDPQQANRLERALCYFRNPVAGAGTTEIVDARELDGGLIAVVTNAGLRFYNPGARSWYNADPNPLSGPGRVYRVRSGSGDYLVLSEGTESEQRLFIIDSASLDVPHSCETGPVTLDVDEALSPLAVAVNEAEGQLAWLAEDGALWFLQDDRPTQILDASRPAPARDDIRRVYARQEALLFTTDTDIWHYDLDTHGWRRIELQLPAGSAPLADINIESSAEENVVVASTIADQYFLGTFAEEDDSVSLSEVYGGGDDFFGANAEALQDVQLRGEDDGLWSFILSDRIQYFNPDDRSWQRTDVFSSTTPITFREVANRGVVVGNQGRSWWIARTIEDHPMAFTRYDNNSGDVQVALDSEGGIWRLRPDGAVLHCTPAVDAYDCATHQSPAFILERDDVLHTFQWAGHVLFEMGDGFRAFDEEAGTEVTLPAALAVLTGVQAMVRHEGWLLFFTPEQVIGLDDQLALVVSETISDFAFDRGGRPWVRMETGWHFLSGGEWIAARTETGQNADEAGLSTYFVPGRELVALDGEGFPYFWDGGQLRRADLPLPPSLQNLDALIRGASSDWWVLSSRRLQHVLQGFCTEAGEVVGSAPPSATPAPSASGPITTSVTPAPTATPHLVPCLYTAGSVTLPFTTVSFAELQGGSGITVWGADGDAYRIGPAQGGAYSVTPVPDVAPRAADAPEDRWGQLQQNAVVLADGQMAYDPVTELVTTGQGALFARRVSGQEHELAGVAVVARASGDPFQLPPALDVGWLRWQRNDDAFRLRAQPADVTLSKEEFIFNNRLLFEDVQALLAPEPERIYAATDRALWYFSGPNLGLNQDSIIYLAPTQRTSLITTAAHGRFVANNHEIVIERGLPAERERSNIQVTVDDVRFVEEVARRRVQATFLTPGAASSPFAEVGFIWDSGRRSVGYDGTRLLLQSDAGIHPVDRLQAFDAGPDALALTEALLESDTGGGVFLRHENGLYRREQGNWITAPVDPLHNRQLVDNSIWDWRLQNGALTIELGGERGSFALVQAGAGMAFTSDLLRAATAYRDSLYVATDAFFEVAPQAAALANLAADRRPPIASDRLQSTRYVDGSERMFNYAGNSVWMWNDDQERFDSIRATEDPTRRHLLAQSNRLRFTRIDGRVVKEVRLDTLDGDERWAEFSFVEQQFPFDYVTSLANLDGTLFVGTAAGLQVYESAGEFALNRLSALYDMRGAASQPLAAVLRAGVPVQGSERLVALSDEVCVEQLSGQQLTLCDEWPDLAQRVRVESEYWRWTEGQGVVGHYRRSDGQLGAEPIQMQDGRLPHDNLKDAVVCESGAFTIWRNGWLSAFGSAGDPFTLDGAMRNYEMAGAGAERFICISRPVAMSQKLLDRGLYMVGAEQSMWLYGNGNWRPVTDPDVRRDVLAYAETPPLFYADKLRLLASPDANALEFEYRQQNGEWWRLPWQDSARVAIDHWQEMVLYNGDLWAATPAGLVGFQLTRNGEVILDGNTVTIVGEPRVGENFCHVTDLAVQNDKVQLRCDFSRQQAYEGELVAGEDMGVFERLTEDPFADQDLISNSEGRGWGWRRVNYHGGSRGYLEATLHGEPVQLTGGKFDFDTITSLALFTEGVVDVGTETGGWYQLARNRVYVEDITYPEQRGGLEPINGVTITGVGEQRRLCLRTLAGDYIRIGGDEGQERTELCPAYFANDTLWLYAGNEGQLSMTAPDSVGGRGQRRLQVGRFSDDVVTGLPVAATGERGHFYFFPTAAGVVRVNARFNAIGLYAGPFAGLEESATPSALYITNDQLPTYAGEDGLYLLNEVYEQTTVSFPSFTGVEITAIEDGPGKFLRLRWRSADGPGWSLLSETQPAMHNLFFVELTGLDKYREQPPTVPLTHPLMTLLFKPQQVDAQVGMLPPQPVELPPDFALLQAIRVGDRILLIGERDVLDLSLESFYEQLVASRPQS